MDEEESRRAWDEYHKKLDPMGKEFMDLLLKINEANRELYKFVLERGQIYGCLLYLMEMMEIDEFDMSTEDFKNMKHYMLFFKPSEIAENTLIITKRVHEHSDLQEPASNTSDEG